MRAARRRFLVCAALAAAGGAARAAAPLVMGYVHAGPPAAGRDAGAALLRAAADDGITLRFADAGQDQQQQILLLRSFIASRVDLIAFSPAAPSGWDTVLREAKAAGIPVLVAGSPIATGDDTLYTAFIGSDYMEQGRRAGRWLAAQAAASPHTVFNVIELQGAVGAPATVARANGCAHALAGQPRLAMLRTPAGAVSRGGATQAMRAALAANGMRIHAVFAHSDDQALGAIAAIEQAGLRPGLDVRLIAIGGGKAALDALAAGKLNAVIACSEPAGQHLMRVARDVLAGRRVPAWVPAVETMFEQETSQKNGAPRF